MEEASSRRGAERREEVIRGRFALAAAGGVLALALSTQAAGAFCRTTTLPVIADFQPSETRCWDGGLPLFWRNACVGYDVQRTASSQVALETARSGMATAFAKWTAASCRVTPSGSSRVSIDIRDLGPVECTEVSYNQNGPNQNLVVFRDEAWPHSDSNNTLALTTVSYNPDTGEIFDADMEINSHDQRISIGDPVPKDGYDFASIVTHETGHFLGLAHSGNSRATMFANYTPGSSALRNLTADDVAGICTIYAPDSVRAAVGSAIKEAPQCDPTPRRGLTSACEEPPVEKSCLGSSRVAGRAPVTPAWIVVGLALGAVLGLRRSRRV